MRAVTISLQPKRVSLVVTYAYACEFICTCVCVCQLHPKFFCNTLDWAVKNGLIKFSMHVIIEVYK